jgi:hypothetical protein
MRRPATFTALSLAAVMALGTLAATPMTPPTWIP